METTQPLKLLLPTKLTSPPALPSWVRRRRLLAQLDAGVAARLTLVIAPAGFGKSTLVAQWLLEAQGAAGSAPGAMPSAVAWLTLDEHDQDGLRALAYIAGAIERVAPRALTLTGPLLTSPRQPPLYVVAQALLVDLSALPGGLTLVLDDYHTVIAEPVHQAVAYLLRNWPPSCRLIIVSRSDPPLPLARLRAERQLTELRIADLRFTEAEAGDLLTGLLGRPPTDTLVATLLHETEGWALALQLAALAAQQSPDSPLPHGAAARQIAEYLADEVFDQQPVAVQSALLALAVPERICAGLGAALLGPPGSLEQAEDVLAMLVRANLFLLPLDAGGRWFRFHHLFRALLLRRLGLAAGQEGVRALHQRAARWLEAEGLIEEALRQYLAAGADDAAAELVERHLLMDLGRQLGSVPPGYWLRMLPDALITRRPGLALIAARLASFNTDVPILEMRIAQVDALLDAPGQAGRSLPWPTFAGDLATLRGSLRYWQGRPAEAIHHLQVALEAGTVPSLASQALHILGKAFVADGRYIEGVGRIEGGFTAAAAVLGELDRPTRHLSLCGMHATAGTVDDLVCSAERLAAAVAGFNLGDFWVCYAEAYRGRAAYEQSDLPTAAAHFAAVARRRYQVNAPIYAGCLSGLSQIACIQGDTAAAAAYVHEVRSFAAEVGGAFLRNLALGCAVRLALARGDHEQALQAARGIGADLNEGINTWFGVEPPRLSQARALLLSAGPAHHAQAELLIAAVEGEAGTLHNTRPLVCALATRALLRQTQGRQGEALAELRRAVALAAPRGYARALADLGPALAPLLRALVAEGTHVDYLARVLALVAPAQGSPPPQPLALPTPTLPELLTPRELEILALLAERWSDKEIAAQLTIAPNTVRKHTSSLFGKLGVSGRREAVTVARALGLLRGV